MKITALFLMASLLAFPAFAQRGGRGGARGAGGHSERNQAATRMEVGRIGVAVVKFAFATF